MQSLEACTVYRHADWVLVNKPAGYSVQELHQAWASEALHPVHRLDKDTSGLWLLATHSDSNRLLSHAFQRKAIQKFYLAITDKKPKKKQGKVIGGMARSRRGQWQLLRSNENLAVTDFRSISMNSEAQKGLRLVLCRPQTGKTHQIRVAMKSIGSPITGDSIYSSGSSVKYDRLYLHAYAIEFFWHDERYRFQCSPDSGDLFSNAEFTAAVKPFLRPFDIFGS